MQLIILLCTYLQLIAYSSNVYMIYAGRVIQGVATGVTSLVGPVSICLF